MYFYLLHGFSKIKVIVLTYLNYFSIIFASCLRHNKVRFHLTWQEVTVTAFVMLDHIYSQMYAYYLDTFDKKMSEACISIIRRPKSIFLIYHLYTAKERMQEPGAPVIRRPQVYSLTLVRESCVSFC